MCRNIYNTPIFIVIVYHNQNRIQQKLGYKSPIEYRQSIA
ncbi:MULTISPECIES: IS3 family transposase [Listeria]